MLTSGGFARAAVVGAGLMGRRIAGVLASAGLDVAITDTNTEILCAAAAEALEVADAARGSVTPVASLDWRGTDSDQVAWVVEGAGARIIHCGDTMWHGNWWQIARDHGPFDVAFLPVNGVIAKFDQPPGGSHHYVIEQGFEMGRPSIIGLEIDMDGGEAAAARISGDAVIVGRGALDL